jgi:hypothetical protein
MWASDSRLPLLLEGRVRHARHRPRARAFAYRSCALLLPMRGLAAQPQAALARNRIGALAFHDSDHGDGGVDALAWVERLLRDEGVDPGDGEIWLLTYPRVLNYVFKPVSFWFVERRDGSLGAVVAEVNNTFGERHVYLLDGPTVRWGATVHARKVFHVSPFCRVQGEYRFRFMRTADRVVARVELHDAEGPLLTTSIGGATRPLSSASAWTAFLRSPAMTLMVTARIHIQALRLVAARVPWFSKPEPPASPISR